MVRRQLPACGGCRCGDYSSSASDSFSSSTDTNANNTNNTNTNNSHSNFNTTTPSNNNNFNPNHHHHSPLSGQPTSSGTQTQDHLLPAFDSLPIRPSPPAAVQGRHADSMAALRRAAEIASRDMLFVERQTLESLDAYDRVDPLFRKGPLAPLFRNPPQPSEVDWEAFDNMEIDTDTLEWCDRLHGSGSSQAAGSASGGGASIGVSASQAGSGSNGWTVSQTASGATLYTAVQPDSGSNASGAHNGGSNELPASQAGEPISRSDTSNGFSASSQGDWDSGTTPRTRGFRPFNPGTATFGKTPAVSSPLATSSFLASDSYQASGSASSSSPVSSSTQTAGTDSSAGSSSNSRGCDSSGNSSGSSSYKARTSPRPAPITSASHPYHATNPSPRLGHGHIRARGGPAQRPTTRQQPNQPIFPGSSGFTALSPTPTPRAASIAASGLGTNGPTSPSSSPQVRDVFADNLSYVEILANHVRSQFGLDTSGLDAIASVATNSRLSGMDNIAAKEPPKTTEAPAAPAAASAASTEALEAETAAPVKAVTPAKEKDKAPYENPVKVAKRMKKLTAMYDRGDFPTDVDLYPQDPANVCGTCGDWRDVKPAHEYEGGVLPDPADRPAPRERHAVAMGNKKDARGEWKVQHVWVYDRDMRVALEKFFEGQWHVDPVSFSAPFHPMLQRWDDFNALIEEQEDLVTRSQLIILQARIHCDFEDELKACRAITETEAVAHKHLPMAFVPGEHVLCRTDDGTTLGGMLGNLTLIKDADTSFWRFKVNHFDWDGKRRVTRTEVYQVQFYAGTRQLEDLRVCPLKLHPQKESMKTALIERGRVFEQLKEGTHSVHVKGRAIDPDSLDTHMDEAEMSVLIDERVIISPQYYHDHEWPFPWELSADALNPRDVIAMCQPKATEVGFHRCKSGSQVDDIPPHPHHSVPEDGPPDMTPWTDDECLMAVDEIRCFVPSRETWYHCKLDNMTDIIWDRNAMSIVETSDINKKMMRNALLNLAHKSEGDRNELDRMTMFITGAPGTGKSLIVEKACEETGMVPYMFDLPSVVNLPCEFKRLLKRALMRCKAFKVPLVIDNAHLLFAEVGDGQIQSLASTIFFQMTEKYSGVILLLSNVEQKLARVVEARIDLRLHFSQLTWDSRYDIWSKRLAHHGWSKDNLNFLSACDLNGHQMNTLEKLSLLLKEGEDWMTMDHVQQLYASKVSGFMADKDEAMQDDETLRHECLEKFERY